MTNRIYTAAKVALGTARLNLLKEPLRIVLTGDYRPGIETDATLDDIPAGQRIDQSGPFKAVSFEGALLRIPVVTLAAVQPHRQKVQGMVLAVAGNSAAGSRLILFIDEHDGLPLPTNGSDVELTWPHGVVQF